MPRRRWSGSFHRNAVLRLPADGTRTDAWHALTSRVDEPFPSSVDRLVEHFGLFVELEHELTPEERRAQLTELHWLVWDRVMTMTAEIVDLHRLLGWTKDDRAMRPRASPDDLRYLDGKARKDLCRRLTQSAIKRGEITKRSCEAPGCSEPDTVVHHEDYTDPLRVRWLCPNHHRDVHKGKLVFATNPENS